MFRYKKLSLNRKIMMITAAAIVPMICLVCYLLWTISYTTGAYADITNNVAKANEYVRDLRNGLTTPLTWRSSTTRRLMSWMWGP